MKTFKIKILKTRLFDNIQSEKKMLSKFSEFVREQEKARPRALHLQKFVGKELEKLMKVGHLEKLIEVDKDCFVSTVVITVNNDKSIKLALNSTMNDSCKKNCIKTWVNY